MSDKANAAGAPARGTSSGPVQVSARLLANAPAGAYREMVYHAPQVAQRARPGQFVAIAVGEESSGLLLRRSFSIHKVTAEGAVHLVVADAGPGTHWLTNLAVGATVDLAGPLGTGFPLPADTSGASVLIGGGYGSAPMFWLADVLRERGGRIHHILGAAEAGRLFGADLVPASDQATITTDDGSRGIRGRVTDPLPEILAASGATTVYACGPMPMLRAVTEVATAAGAQAYVAVEEAMACGVGICMTCVLPAAGADGQVRMSRACVDGPVFPGTSVQWAAIADGRVSVPTDCLGAPGTHAGVR